MPWQRSDRATSRSIIRRAYEAYRCPPAAYSRAKGKAWGRAARTFAPAAIAAVMGLAAFMFVALGQDTQLREAAEALQAADAEDGTPIASVSAYEERLVEIQRLTGAPIREIVLYTLEATHRLKGVDPETPRSALSVLQSVTQYIENVPDDRRPRSVREYFDRATGLSGFSTMPEKKKPEGPAEDYMQGQPPGMWEYLPGQGRESQGEAYGYN
ncbi:MAG: hypothetical protein GF393_01785 [Armatimonadia bacterium]|nr:hypothetical protein [Armatimonadia bacterium]